MYSTTSLIGKNVPLAVRYDSHVMLNVEETKFFFNSEISSLKIDFWWSLRFRVRHHPAGSLQDLNLTPGDRGVFINVAHYIITIHLKSKLGFIGLSLVNRLSLCRSVLLQSMINVIIYSYRLLTTVKTESITF